MPLPDGLAHDHLTVDGGELHLLRAGTEGPLVVLVHGLDGSAANWVTVAADLARDHRVVVPDLPGFGRTTLAGRRSSMTSFADVVARVVEAEDAGPAVVAGNSMGGVVVTLAGARHPDLVSGVSLVAPAVPRAGGGRLDPSMLPALLALWTPGVGAATGLHRASQPPRERVDALLRLCVDPANLGRLPDEAVEEMVVVAAARTRDDQVRGWTSAARSLWAWLVRRGAYHDAADAIRGPVQVLEGARDPIIPASSIADTVARHPTWEHVRMEGVGHVPPLEAPADTAGALRRLVAAAHAARA
ncbi:MAG: alpha/beta fold hydrolase [Actinomycetes bacterium]